MLLADCRSIEIAVEAAERLRHAVKALIQVDDSLIVAAVSVGVAVDATGDTSIESLVRAADVAMLAAKDGGRDRIRVASLVVAEL